MVLLLLYMIKPGLLDWAGFSAHLLAVWKRLELRGVAACERMTEWLGQFLSLYRCARFRELCEEGGGVRRRFPTCVEENVLEEVLDRVLGYWSDKESDVLERSLTGCISIL